MSIYCIANATRTEVYTRRCDFMQEDGEFARWSRVVALSQNGRKRRGTKGGGVGVGVESNQMRPELKLSTVAMVVWSS